jgi:hypothetical protein
MIATKLRVDSPRAVMIARSALDIVSKLHFATELWRSAAQIMLPAKFDPPLACSAAVGTTQRA